MQTEALSYVPAARTLIDENGLAVGRGVNPDDAARIIAAMSACRGLPALMEETRDNHVYNDGDEVDDNDAWAITARLATEAGADEPRPVMTSPLAALIDLGHKMLEFEADEFDGPADMDLHVSGADMIDAFTGWRSELRDLLKAVTEGRTEATAAVLRSHGYFVSPDGPNRWKGVYLAPGAVSEVCIDYAPTEAEVVASCVAHLKANDVQPRQLEPLTIYVSRTENEVSAWASRPAPGVEIVTLNWDIDDLRNYDTNDITMVGLDGADAEPCLVSRAPLASLDTVPDMRPATDEDMPGNDA